MQKALPRNDEFGKLLVGVNFELHFINDVNTKRAYLRQRCLKKLLLLLKSCRQLFDLTTLRQ